jgi:hypothetical protein
MAEVDQLPHRPERHREQPHQFAALNLDRTYGTASGIVIGEPPPSKQANDVCQTRHAIRHLPRMVNRCTIHQTVICQGSNKAWDSRLHVLPFAERAAFTLAVMQLR